MKIIITGHKELKTEYAYDANHEVILFSCNVDELIKKVASYKYLLSATETATYQRYNKAADAANFLAGRVLVRLLFSKLNNCLAEDILILPGENNKPVAVHKHGKELKISCFNLSHHANVLIIAMTTVPVGVDVEKIGSVDYTCMINDVCTDKEIDFLQKETFSAGRFFCLWTRKEAVLKCMGIGLIDDLKRLQLCEDVNYFSHNGFGMDLCFIHDLTILDEYVASICYASDKQLPVYFLDVNKVIEDCL